MLKKFGLLAGVLLAIAVVAIVVLKPWSLERKTEGDLFSLGQVAASKGNHQEAVKIYRTLLTKDPKHYIAQRFMLESLSRFGSKAEVLEAAESLIKMESSKGNLEFAASLYLQHGEKEKAEQILQQIKK